MTIEVRHEWATTRDGRQLHVERAGEGTPVVVFEAGMGASRSSWGAVVAAVAPRTSTAAYDRSGLGRSAPAAGRRDLAQLVDDLHDVLDHLGEGPFVLVGHSWGGPIVRVAAATRPERIAGLVLVDQSDESFDLFFDEKRNRRSRRMTKALPLAARLGVVRLGVKRLAGSLPEPSRTEMIAEDGTVAAARTLLAELTSFVDDLRDLRDRPPTLPDVPVTLISGMRSSRMERGERPGLIAAHRARAAALPRGRHVEAHRSSHYIPTSEPELVAGEIMRIVDSPGG